MGEIRGEGAIEAREAVAMEAGYGRGSGIRFKTDESWITIAKQKREGLRIGKKNWHVKQIWDNSKSKRIVKSIMGVKKKVVCLNKISHNF